MGRYVQSEVFSRQPPESGCKDVSTGKKFVLKLRSKRFEGGRERHPLVTCLGMGKLCELAVATTTRLPLQFGLSGFGFGVESVEFEPFGAFRGVTVNGMELLVTRHQKAGHVIQNVGSL